MKKVSVGLVIIMLAALFLFAGCSNSNKDGTAKDFSIYLVENLTASEAMGKSLDDLPLEAAPVLTDKEIKTYDWKKHTFTLEEGFSLEEKLKGKVPLSGKPFVVVVGSERVYLGSFWSPISSLYNPDIPIINSIWADGIKKDTYSITCGNKEKDPRDDMRIYKALKGLKIIVE